MSYYDELCEIAADFERSESYWGTGWGTIEPEDIYAMGREDGGSMYE